jgi:hypothetical protein
MNVLFMSLMLDLVQKDQTLTDMLNREGESAPISNGKVSKNTFTFMATFDGATETVEGTLRRTTGRRGSHGRDPSGRGY